MILIRFRYDLLLWIVSGAILQLSCWYSFRYDFDVVSVMILDVGQTCDLKPTHRNHIQNRITTISKPYQNHIKTMSKPQKVRAKIAQKHVPGLFLFLFFEANSLEPYQNRIKIISKSYQNRITSISTSYQNRITTKSKSCQNHTRFKKIARKPVPGLFLFLFFEANSLEPYQSRIKFISKSHQKHIIIVSKSYQNQIKIVSKPQQNHIKTTKTSRNRLKT